MQSYVDLLESVLSNGVEVTVGRNQSTCLTLPHAHLTLSRAKKPTIPIVTLRKINYRAAIGEMLGYMRGFTHIDQFHELGVKTWDANANDNPVWNASPFKNGEGDLGLIYGAIGNHWKDSDGHIQLSYRDIVQRIRTGEHDRGLIWSFWNPSLFEQGCLRPCMYQHQFTVINDTLHLISTQRSCDLGLGGPFNFFQCYFLLWITAKLTGKKMGDINWCSANVHLYDNQIPVIKEMLKTRTPRWTKNVHFYANVDFNASDAMLDYVLEDVHPRDFALINYDPYPHLKIPFTV